MSNPLRMFRKYQATFLVAFGILLMIAFVVGPIVTDYLSSGAIQGTGEDGVVVTWKGRQLRESEMANLRTVHLQTTRFLRELVQCAVVLDNNVQVQRQGQTITLKQGRSYELRNIDADGFHINVAGVTVVVPENMEGENPKPQIRQLGRRERLIPQSPGEEDLVRRLLLAEEARKQGVVVGEDAVMDYLDTLCGVTQESRPEPSYDSLLKVSTRGRLDMQRFVGHLAMELAADRMLVMLRRGFLATPTGMPAAPPEVLFESYNKLNRRVTAEMMAVRVSDFMGEVREPEAEEITALYKEGKDEFPYPQSPDPGFKRRKKIAFQYVVARFDEFMQREKDKIGPTITDEEIEQYYKDNPDQFKEMELPESDSSEGTEAEDAKAEAKSDPAAKTETSEPEMSESESDTTSADPTVEAESTEPAKKEPAETEPAKTEAETEPAKADATEPEKVDAAGTDEQVSTKADPVMFVTYQEPDAQGEPAKKATGEPEGTPAKPETEDPKTEDPKTEDPKMEEQPGSEAGKTDPTSNDTTGDDTSTGDTDASAESGEPAETEAAKEPPAKIKPLDDELREEIRGRIAEQKARPLVRDQVEKSVEAVRSAVEEYSRDLELATALDSKLPTPVDVEAIARDNNLDVGETPLWDELDISEIRDGIPGDDEPPADELARATENVEFRFNRSLMNSFAGELEEYSPFRLVDGIIFQQQFPIDPQKVFVLWRVDQVDEYVPELVDVQTEVINAWKMKAALPKAQEKADELAKQARQEGKSLLDVFPEDREGIVSSMQFSWMTRGSTPSGTPGRPMLSQINGLAGGQPKSIAGAGNEFMRSVFSLRVGEVGTATNEPEDFVYVVRVVSEDLSEQQRRDAFYVTGLTPEVVSLVNIDQTQSMFDWIEAVDKTYDVQWERPAVNDWRFDQ